MDGRSILQKIIEENGCCDWALKYHPTNPNYICSMCPMSKLKKTKDGRYLSCFEALSVDSKPMTANGVYLEAAVRLLADILMHDVLTGETEHEIDREE